MCAAKYRAGVIGCGWVSTGHMNGYRCCPAIEVVAAADVSEKALEEFAKEYGTGKLYTDYGDMLEKEKLDIVSICTWPTIRSDLVLKAAECGVKAIYLEKPMALGLSEARDMMEACDKAGCKLMVGHQRRLETRYVKAKELVDQGAIGTLHRIEARQWDSFTDDHGIDLILFFAGDPAVRWVIGQVDWKNSQQGSWGHVVEAAGLGYIKFENDMEGVVLIGRAVEGHEGYSVILTGTEGVIEISGGNYPAESWVKLLNKDSGGWKRIDVDVELTGEPRTEILGRPTIEYYWVGSWKAFVEKVVDCIETGNDHGMDGRAAYRTLEIIGAIFESSRTRSQIRFPLTEEVDYPLESIAATHKVEQK